MVPLIAIIGRPNVGKSTVFNRLVRKSQALVLDLPGTTLDRHYGRGAIGAADYIVIDTGGLSSEQDVFATKLQDQTWQAIDEADIILFVVDAKAGLTATDIDIAKELNAEAINPDFEKLDLEVATKIKEAGFKIYTWTVNEPSDIELAKSWSVDGIITNYPERVN